MNATLYHQKTREDLKGRKIYIGEDAYPYADNQIIISADGLGGRGGYPHTKINREIVNKDKFYDIVFAPVFTESVSNEFKSFVVNSFYEIFETKDYYFENSSTMRSSGYFASRLVCAIALYELKYNKTFEKESVFRQLKEGTEEQKATLPQQLGDKLSELIGEKLSTIAKNVGFEVETRISGAYLLPSTLTVALIDEHETDADVLYFWAGDSRGYVWDAKGLGQITEDHERDETMTNLITLTKPFRIEARLITVGKPCLLFNATDGCYKCPVFDSPFDLEYIFLKSIEESSNFDDAMDFLKDQFGQIGRHDDSNTMALISLGFDDYQGIKSAVKERLSVIDDTIIAKLPGILQINYPEELRQIESQINEGLFAIKDKLIANDGIVEFVKKQMERSCYSPFIKETMDLTAEKNSRSTRIEQLLTEIKEWIKNHWIEFPGLKKYSGAARNFKSGFFGIYKKDPFEQYEELKAELNRVMSDHRRSVEETIERLRSASAEAENTLRRLVDIKQADTFDYGCFSDNKTTIIEALEYVKALSKKDTPPMIKYKAVMRQIKELNQTYVEFDYSAIDALFNSIIKGELEMEGIAMLPEDLMNIGALLSEYNSLSSEIVALDDKIKGLVDKHMSSYWNDKHEELILAIWQDHRFLIPDELMSAISDEMSGLKEKHAEMKRCCETREKIYADYDVTYRRIYEESKI